MFEDLHFCLHVNIITSVYTWILFICTDSYTNKHNIYMSTYQQEYSNLCYDDEICVFDIVRWALPPWSSLSHERSSLSRCLYLSRMIGVTASVSPMKLLRPWTVSPMKLLMLRCLSLLFILFHSFIPLYVFPVDR